MVHIGRSPRRQEPHFYQFSGEELDFLALGRRELDNMIKLSTDETPRRASVWTDETKEIRLNPFHPLMYKITCFVISHHLHPGADPFLKR